MKDKISQSNALLVCSHYGCAMEHTRNLNNLGLYKISLCESTISALETIRKKSQKIDFFIYDNFFPSQKNFDDTLNISYSAEKIILISDICEHRHIDITIWAWENKIRHVSIIRKPLAFKDIYNAFLVPNLENIIDSPSLIQEYLP